MKEYDFFLENHKTEVYSPLNKAIIRSQLAKLDIEEGSFLVIQNKLKVGEFLQCMWSKGDQYILELKSCGKIYQYKTTISFENTLAFIELYLKDELYVSMEWKQVIL